MIETKDMLKMSSYFSKIHHTPGRLRVKIDKAILEEVKDISLGDITSLPDHFNGLNKIKVNKIMATATITYDASIFEPAIWNNLIDGTNLDENAKLLNKLQSKIKEIK